MKTNKLNLLFLYILYLYGSINCKNFYIDNLNEIKNNKTNIFSTSNTYSYRLMDNDKQIDEFETEIINKKIEIGKVQTEILNYSYIYEFYFSDFSDESDLIVNFYPLDCQIKISGYDKNDMTINKLSNYEYDAFSVVIKKDKIKSSYIKIQPLIISLEEKNKIRNYHLVINSFNENKPLLTFNEKLPKFPTLIHFDSNLDKMELSYELNNSEEPVVFSFFIKEKNRFEANIIYDETLTRIIGYKDNIIINPKKDYNNINITIYKIDKKNCNMIIKVSGNNIYPFYLQKNFLNLGFMPINTFNHYYYMEIFKGEEGEIMLHNKFHKGFLLSKIMKKSKKDEGDLIIDDFPKYDENEILFNKYNEYSKKLNFSSEETDECENGCYLLITYYSPETKLENIDGIEYTLLARIWDEDEFKSQIVNIPLNEFVFGAIEPSFSSINAHYYSAFIPEDNDIIFEFHGRNIHSFVKKGLLQINILKKPYNSIHLTENIKNSEIEDEKLMVKINKKQLELESFENQYISFAFKVLDDVEWNSLLNFYYFRIIQETPGNEYMIYPLDSNKANFCQTSKKKDNYACYFLLKNDYKELTNNFTIYAYGREQVMSYNSWATEQLDYYSINIDTIIETNIYNFFRNNGGYFKLNFKDKAKFVLLEINSKYEETLDVLFNFDGPLIPSPSLDIYSYQSFYLRNDIYKSFDFESIPPDKYNVGINNTSGDGYICINQKCNDNDRKTFISKNIFLSFTLSEKIKSIHFYSEKNLFFSIKIKNRIPNDIMEEIYYGFSYKNFTKNSNTSKAYYYIKDIYSYGVDINLFFDFDGKRINISGYLANYDDIKYIEKYEQLDNLLKSYRQNKNNIKGTYDPFTKSGLIIFDNIISKNESNKEDKYYLIELSSQDNTAEFSVEIFIDSKNNSLFPLQKNKYIRGSFNLFNTNKIQKNIYNIEFEKNHNNSFTNYYIFEFSSNLEYIKPIFNEGFKYDNKTNIGGVQQYFFSSNSIKTLYNVTIQINNTINNYNINKDLDLGLYLANYIIKLYKIDTINNMDFLIEKDINYTKIKNINGNIFIYNITIKPKKVKNYCLNENFTYTYFIRLYLEKSLDDFQQLNTIALIYNNKNNINDNDNYFEYKTSDPNEAFSFTFNISENEKYIMHVFIKINGINSEEQYLSTSFEVNTNTKSEDSNKLDESEEDKNKTETILLIILSGIFFITIIISITTCQRYKSKNKTLKEQVQSISFSGGINTDKNKDDEVTFI